MANFKGTKRSLLMSALALVLCVSMLVGSTFAWFTDTATTGVNKIQSGTLDVELLMYDGTNWVNAEGKTLNFIAKDGNQNILWEPGCTYELPALKVVNKGNLVLKYEILITGITGNAKLLEVIDFTVENEGSLTGTLAPEAETPAITLIGHMDEQAGNEYQNLTVEGISITVYATQMTAEFDSYDDQYDADSSYIDPWDGQSASYEWFTGENAGTYTLQTAADLAGFANIVNGTAPSSSVARAATYQYGFSGQTVRLSSNINLGNKSWTPIGVNADASNKFYGTFDGQGHTIYNLLVDYTAETAAYKAAGLFGALNGTVKYLNVDGATINALSSGDPTDNGIAVIAGSIYTKGSIDNVSVTNAVVNGNRYVGGIAGYAYGNITNCSVTNSVLTATPDQLSGSNNNGDKIGGIAGYWADESVHVLSGNSVSNIHLTGYRDIGGIAGSANAGKVTNNTATDVTIMVDQETYFYEAKAANAAGVIGRVLSGTVAGSNTAENITVINASELGDNGVKVDDESGLYYDGKDTWGTYYVFTAADLMKASEYFVHQTNTSEGDICTVELMADIDLSGYTWTPWTVMWVNFNGNGHTISNITTAEGWRGGFMGYAGATKINDLTLENVHSYGAQAGIFAGSAEGLTVNNCYLKGDNSVTYVPYVSDTYTEDYSGIGAITGVLTSSTVNVEIVEGATVTLNKGTMTTKCDYVDTLTGYLGTNSGTITNNGTVTVNTTVTSSAALNAALADGGNIELSQDVTYSSKITNDADIDLAGNTFEATSTITLTGNSDLTMAGGDYEVNSTYGHIDVRPDSADGSTVVFEDVNFSFNKLNKTYGPSTNRLGTVLEFTATAADGKAVIVFRNCTFDNASVLFEGLSSAVGQFEATFENCTFNALTSSSPIEAKNYVKGTINVIGCTFNLECTSSSAAAVCVSPSSSTTVTINAEGNTFNAVAATPYTYDAAAGEDETYNVKVNGTPANIKFISASSNCTINETGTVKTGIAAQ